MRLTIGYSDSEDRLWIRTEASNALWWVTRRLAMRLVAQWADVLERSLPEDASDESDASAAGVAASGGPQDAARGLRRREALRREHDHALVAARDRKVGPVERPPPGVALENTLLATVSLSAGEKGVRLVLKAAGRSETLRMSRAQAHRLLDALFSRCRRIGWYAGPASTPEWLGPADGDADRDETAPPL